MKVKISLIIIFVSLSQVGLTQEFGISGKPEDRLFKDSMGLVIGYDKALKLLRSGEYVSVPELNSAMEIEHYIVNKKSQPGKRYQTQTDGNIVLTTVGHKMSFELNMGDTIPVFESYNYKHEIQYLAPDSLNRSKVLIFLPPQNEGERFENEVKNLISQYPNCDFIVCSTKKNLSLISLFAKEFLKKRTNIFIADSKAINLIFGEKTPSFLLADNNNKVSFLIPPLSSKEVGHSVLKNILQMTFGKDKK